MFKVCLFIIFKNCFLFSIIIRITRKTGKTCLISGLFFLAPFLNIKEICFIKFLAYLIISIFLIIYIKF